ncbi:hypothetical protein BDY24DRAFT_402296 [Mrakia frigida]|uniref:uncharacterized protein n=1 Tax=Mrakia frigida TaxID=29902 RepID=UPI003FCC00CE
MEVVEGERTKWASDRTSSVEVPILPSFHLTTTLSHTTKPTLSSSPPPLFFSRTQMATAALLTFGAVVAGLGGRAYFRALANQAGKGGADAWVKGGFQAKMDAKEAKAILGIRDPVTMKKLKEAHRRIMLVNHPDRNGSPYLASKINEAKDLLDKTTPK